MKNLTVHVVTVEPMRIASAYGFGHNPEEQAWQRLVAWAGPKGLLENRNAHPVFGFNNPNPTEQNSKYGYEFWIKVDPGTEPDGEIRIAEFNGGTYAVARCEAGSDPGATIPATWKSLADWCKENNRRFAHHQPMEKIMSDPGDPAHLELELYCPIVE